MKELDQLLKTVRILRSSKGCPWDRIQKVEDMKGYLLEEVYELIDGIDRKQTKAVEEELGDIFLILIVITEMFRCGNKFDLAKVLKKINNKLISRHPHVFNSKKLKNKEEVLKYWIKSKARQKGRRSVKDRLPHAAPSLLLANIFFKECAYLDSGKPIDRNRKKLHSSLESKVKSLRNNDSSEKLLSDIVIDISRIAFRRGINLETQTRKAILREAKKTRYNNGG